MTTQAVEPTTGALDVAEPEPTNAVDVRPIIPRISKGLFQRTEEVRDRLFAAAKDELTRRGLRGNVLRSPPLSESPWVSIEIWTPIEEDRLLTRRSVAILRLHLKPYHKFEIEYTLDLTYCGDQKKIPALSHLEAGDVVTVIAYLLGERPRPSFVQWRIRRWLWEFWKPANKPAALKTDWLGRLPAIFIVSGMLAFGVTFGVPVGFVFIVVGIGAGVLIARRKAVVRTSGRPGAEPRILVGIDSWQTVIFSLGSDVDDLRRRFVERLKRPLSTNMRWAPEDIWYWGLDGTVEREQIVLTHGRAILFVHIHRYDDDLYIGWDAHLNRGQWGERDVYRGIDRDSGRLAVIRVVETVIQRLTEYDVTDANSLIEWTHAQIVQVAKALMAEQKIEQEIDFKIIRGERSDLTTREGSSLTGDGVDGGGGVLKRTKSLLRRTG